MSQTSSGKKGSISPTVIYTNKDALQGNPTFVPGVPPIIECCLPPKSGNWVVTFVGEQYLWTPEGAHVSRADGGREEDFDVATQFFGQNQPGVEAYYNFAITPWLQISADLQYVNSGLSVLT